MMAGLIEEQVNAGMKPIAPLPQAAPQQTIPIERVDAKALDQSVWGKRTDGSQKGLGYFGALKRPDGDVSTELSIGINFGQGDVEIPLLVPTLSRKEIAHLLDGGEPTKAIIDKAAMFALDRMKSGKNAYASQDEMFDLPEE